MKTFSNNYLTDAAVQWLQTVLHERLSPALRLFYLEPNILAIAIDGASGKIVFDQPQKVFSDFGADIPSAVWHPQKEGWVSILDLPLPAPGLSFVPYPLIERAAKKIIFHYDVLGFVYWMLSRHEEVGYPTLDGHQRFPAAASHAFRYGYLDRPIVDEWMHILRQAVIQVWPQLVLVAQKFEMKPSHDVDIPSRYAFRSAKAFFRAIANDVVRQRRYRDALRALKIRWGSKHQIHKADPANTFDWIMDISEKYSLKSAFYFICGRTHPELDAGYEPDAPAIRSLMRRIHNRGHEIGLHPSYGTYRSPQLMEKEAFRLKEILIAEGIQQSAWGGRMHYLRWEIPTTLYGWEKTDAKYDSTLGYADYAGFRCGTCFEYPAFDPVAQRSFRLRIRPLIAMECTVMAKQYMALGTGKAAYEVLTQLKQNCRKVEGVFTLLWHNSELTTSACRELYESILAY